MEILSNNMIAYLKEDLSYKAKTQICRLLVDVIRIDGYNLEIDLIVPSDDNNSDWKRKEARLDLVKDFFEEWNSFIDKNKTSEDNILESSTLRYVNGRGRETRTHNPTLPKRVR